MVAQDVVDIAHNLGAQVKSRKLYLDILYRFGYIPNQSGTPARARGLGVMTLP